MTIHSLEVAQEAIVSHLKSKTTLTNVVGVNEVREYQWQGLDFTYPNVRVQLLPFSPSKDGCLYQDISFNVLCFSEQASSLESSQIAGIITTILHDTAFTSNNVAFNQCMVRSITPPYRQDTNTWRSTVLVVSRIS